MSVPNQAYDGAKKEIAFTPESTRGTLAQVRAGDFQPHEGFGFGPKAEKVTDERGRGKLAKVRKTYLHREYANGDIPLAVTKDFVGHISNMIVGQVPTTTSLGGGLYSHVWAVNNSNRHISYTTHVWDPILGWLYYPLATMNTAQLDLNVDGFARAVINMEADKEVANSAKSYNDARSYSSVYEYPIFMPDEITFRIATTLAGLASAEDFDANAVPFNVNKGAEKRFKHGQKNPADIVTQMLGISGNLTSVYNNNIIRQLALTQAVRALQIKFTSGSDYWQLQFPEVSFSEWNEDEATNEYMNNTAQWVVHDTDDNGIVVITVVNQISSYAA